jgi:hypothetical protein
LCRGNSFGPAVSVALKLEMLVPDGVALVKKAAGEDLILAVIITQ